MTTQPAHSGRPVRHRATCATCGQTFTRPTVQSASNALWWHDVEHRGGVATIRQLPQVTFHAQAVTALRALAATGKPFTVGDAHPMVESRPVNPQTEWPKALREVVAEGSVVWTGEYAESKVPTTKGSAVKVWIGTAKAMAA